MKVLFVYSGQDIFARTHTVESLGNALEDLNINIDYYNITGKGLGCYFKHIPKLRKFLKQQKFDLIHAQFGYSGFTCAMAGSSPLIVSLMGSDFGLAKITSLITKIFANIFFDYTILKSQKMIDQLSIKSSKIIPNGINIDRFTKVKKSVARSKIGFTTPYHVLWISDPERKEKNFALAREAFATLGRDDVELTIVNNVDVRTVPYYYYAADVLLLTSKWEGSPNVIKEAIACELPIVSTDVGDVSIITKGIEGCYIVTSDPKVIAKAIDQALLPNNLKPDKEKVTHLDIKFIAEENLKIYHSLLSKRKIQKKKN